MHPVLTQEQCLSLHVALLKDTIDKVRDLRSLLYLSGSGYLPFDPGLPVQMQTGADLGERMSNAFEKEFRSSSKVVIIGIDSPTFPADQISGAFRALEHHDIVLGPSEDGGYYLIGLNKPIPEMFYGIPWGSPEVLQKSLEKISHRRYSLLDSYFDVDLPRDLMRLQVELEKQNSANLKNIRGWMAGYFKK